MKIFRFTAGFGGSGGFPWRRIQQRDLILCGFLLANPQTRLVGLQDRSAEEPGADRRSRLGEVVPCRVEHVDERALADLETEKIGQECTSRSKAMPWVKRK